MFEKSNTTPVEIYMKPFAFRERNVEKEIQPGMRFKSKGTDFTKGRDYQKPGSQQK